MKNLKTKSVAKWNLQNIFLLYWGCPSILNFGGGRVVNKDEDDATIIVAMMGAMIWENFDIMTH